MKYLLFSGSLRTESLNKKLLSVASHIIASQPENNVVMADIRSFAIPVYDGDIESNGIPDGVVKFGEMIKSSNAIVISSPEYNSSISGALKNTIDWVSRLRPVPFEAKTLFLLGASPGGFGAIRGLAATRTPLEALGCYVYPQTFALAKAHEAFAKDGTLLDTVTYKKLTDSLLKFDQFTKKLTLK